MSTSAPAGPSTSSSTNYTPKELILIALQANTNHQYALEKYTERLTAELQEVDRLLDLADSDDSDQEVEGDIEIPGATKPSGPIPANDFLNPESPFYEDSVRRSRYLNFTNPHPMKNRELEALTDAVTDEFRRLKAVDSRKRGLGIPSTVDPVDLNGDAEKLDWTIVAEKVSDVSSFKRTAEECKIKWLGHRRPIINHGEWKPEELEKLTKIVAERQAQQTLDWVEVAKELGTNRTPLDCMRNGIPRARHSWDADYDQKLLEGVQIYGMHNWSLVALHVSEHATANQCQMRYIRTLDPSLKKGAWTQEEDDRLVKAHAALGPNWIDVAAHVPGRTNEQCRERYQDHINPTVRRVSQWTDEEDEQLMKAVNEVGHRWKKICELMGNKSETQCRTRFNKIRQKHSASASASTSAILAAENAATLGSPQESLSPTTSGDVNSDVQTIPQDSTPIRFISTTGAPAPRARPKPKPKGKQKQGEVPDTAISDEAATSLPQANTRKRKRRGTDIDDDENIGSAATPSLGNPTLQGDPPVSGDSEMASTEDLASRRVGQDSGAGAPSIIVGNCDTSSNVVRKRGHEDSDDVTHKRGRGGQTDTSPGTRRSARLAGKGSE